jgi:glycine betaine/proline transport system permease protein
MSFLLSTVLAQEDGVSFWDSTWFNENLPPFGTWIDSAIDWLAVNLATFWDIVAWPIDTLLTVFTDFLIWVPWPIVVVAVAAIGWVARNWKVGIGSGVALLAIGFLGPDYWDLAMETFAMIITAVFFCIVLGMPLGIIAARSDRADGAIRPALDAMQTIHPFVYLLPAVFFFGIGTVPGVIVTVIFAMPPMVRLTNLGIRQVPSDVVEAARAFGTRDFQLLREIQLPLARPTILAGLNQSLMLSLSMVVIAALIAAGGIGQAIVRGVQNADNAQAGTSGIAVLLIALILDRLSQPVKESE